MIPATSTRTTKSKILVVDDEEINREIIAAMLEEQGYEVLQAGDGIECLRIVETQNPDLMLLDVVMPGMDGFEVCRRVKEEMTSFFLPIVFITGLNDRESRVRGKAVGCDDFLTKPADPIELNARVRNLLRVKAYHDLRAHQKELLQEELDRTRDQLIRVDRMATLGTLAAGVGHELNNILSVLQMTVDMMRQRAHQNLPVRDKDLERLDTVVLHVGTHATQLLNFGRPGPQFAEKIDLREAVKQTLEMLRASGRTKTAAVEFQPPPNPVVAEVNRTRFEQVIVNLVGNAIDAMAELKGVEKRVKVQLNEQVGGRIFCVVEDTGCGIPADKLALIFDPYYTTKAPGKGTGLGLPVVKTIVESYGGVLEVKSQVGVGTRFTFDLPAA